MEELYIKEELAEVDRSLTEAPDEFLAMKDETNCLLDGEEEARDHVKGQFNAEPSFKSELPDIPRSSCGSEIPAVMKREDVNPSAEDSRLSDSLHTAPGQLTCSSRNEENGCDIESQTRTASPSGSPGNQDFEFVSIGGVKQEPHWICDNQDAVPNPFQGLCEDDQNIGRPQDCGSGYSTGTQVGEFECSLCRKNLDTKVKLVEHFRTHTRKKLYHCNACKKQFTYSSTLKIHRVIHSGEKPYTCQVCKKQFTMMSNLKIHSMIHSGERPYRCEICEKEFTTTASVKRHSLVHTGEKPYRCDVCKREFTTTSNLKMHRMIHSGEKPYQCEQCKSEFISVSNLKKHRTVHTG